MKKTIKEWLDERNLYTISRVDKSIKVDEKEFNKLLKDIVIFENKFYSK